MGFYFDRYVVIYLKENQLSPQKWHQNKQIEPRAETDWRKSIYEFEIWCPVSNLKNPAFVNDRLTLLFT